MAIEEKYEVERCSQSFDNPMDAVKKATELSESYGAPIKLFRCVKYTGEQEFRKYTMSTVEIPREVVELGGMDGNPAGQRIDPSLMRHPDAEKF